MSVVTHLLNPSTQGGRGKHLYNFEASLVSRVSSRTAGDTQRNPVSGKEKEKKRTKKIKLFLNVVVKAWSGGTHL